MKAVVAAFNQETGEGPSSDYEPSDAIRMKLFEALVIIIIMDLIRLIIWMSRVYRTKWAIWSTGYTFRNKCYMWDAHFLLNEAHPDIRAINSVQGLL